MCVFLIFVSVFCSTSMEAQRLPQSAIASSLASMAATSGANTLDGHQAAAALQFAAAAAAALPPSHYPRYMSNLTSQSVKPMQMVPYPQFLLPFGNPSIPGNPIVVPSPLAAGGLAHVKLSSASSDKLSKRFSPY